VDIKVLLGCLSVVEGGWGGLCKIYYLRLSFHFFCLSNPSVIFRLRSIQAQGRHQRNKEKDTFSIGVFKGFLKPLKP
jgi:hypothetical protein